MAPKKGQTNNPNGRKKGVPNKSTAQAREAIANFVDKNTGRLERLLDKIEAGTPKLDGDGEFVGYSVDPDPKGAFDAITKVMEYHLPKLARTETKLEGELTTIINVNSQIPFAPNEKPKDAD
jgi:hypothetical protein